MIILFLKRAEGMPSLIRLFKCSVPNIWYSHETPAFVQFHKEVNTFYLFIYYYIIIAAAFMMDLNCISCYDISYFISFVLPPLVKVIDTCIQYHSDGIAAGICVLITVKLVVVFIP